MNAYTLHPVSGTILSQPQTLAPGENTVGRSRSCDVRVGEPDVSGKHCVIKITGEAVAVENLSQNGTLLDGQPLEFITLIQPGQILTLGASTQIRLDKVSDPLSDASPEIVEETEPSPPEDPGDLPTGSPLSGTSDADDDEETGKGSAWTPPPEPMDRTAQGPISPPPHSPVPPSSEDDWMEQTQSAYDQTREMETRVLRPEDIEALRENERTKPRKRITLVVIAGIVLVVAAFFLWPESKAPETEFEWPRDASNEFINAEADGIRGGMEAGEYMIGLPWSPDWSQSRPDENTLVVTTRLSRDFNVPMVLHLTEHADPANLRHDLGLAARAWMAEMRDKSTGWHFDAPSETIFLGSENGVPFVTISYAHQENGSWHGVARIFLYHDRRVVLRSEVPYTERVRASRLVNLRYLIVSREFERRFWAGSPEEPADSAGEILRRVRPDLQRDAPAVWAGLEQQLFQACRRAALDGDAATLAEAEEMILSLRERQRRWFNAQRIARIEAERTEQRDRVRQITELCKAVFSHEGDLRHFVVRRERW